MGHCIRTTPLVDAYYSYNIIWYRVLWVILRLKKLISDHQRPLVPGAHFQPLVSWTPPPVCVCPPGPWHPLPLYLHNTVDSRPPLWLYLLQYYVQCPVFMLRSAGCRHDTTGFAPTVPLSLRPGIPGISVNLIRGGPSGDVGSEEVN